MQETHFIAHAIFLCVMDWVSGVAPPQLKKVVFTHVGLARPSYKFQEFKFYLMHTTRFCNSMANLSDVERILPTNKLR